MTQELSMQQKNENYRMVTREEILKNPKDFKISEAIGKACYSQNYKKYGYYDNWNTLWNYIAKDKLPKGKNTFNELIVPGQRVKPYLDVEWHKEEFPNLRFNRVVDDFIQATVEFFATEYNINISEEDIYVKKCNRTTAKGYKWSFHLIVSPKNNIVFNENTDVLFFARRMKQILNFQEEYPKLIDESVYSRQRNLRLLDHCKADEPDAYFQEHREQASPDKTQYLVTCISPKFHILPVEEQAWNQNTDYPKGMPLNDDLVEKLITMVKKYHVTAEYQGIDTNDFHQFNYTDRKERCFWSGNLHAQLGFFCRVDSEGYVNIGCHSARCVDVTSDKKQYRMKPIGNIYELSEDDKKRRAVSFNEKIFPPHALIETEIFKKALGLSNIFEELYLKPVSRIKWIDNGTSRTGITYFWNGKIWREDDHLFIHRLLSITLPRCLNSYIRSISGKDYHHNEDLSASSSEISIDDDIATEVSVNMSQEQIVKLCRKLIDQLNTGTINTQILNFIRPLINDNDFSKIKDIHPGRLSVKNGMIDLVTGKISEAEPNDNITKALDLPYHEDIHGCCSQNYQIWDQFVRDITRSKNGELNEDVYNYLKWLIGYSIQGVPKKKLFVIMWGPEGYNGKSLLLNTLSAVLEDYAVTMDKNIILTGKQKTAGSHSTEFVRLENCRLGILSDTAEDCCIDDGQIKQLTSITDKISVREIYGKQKEMRPTLVPIVATNYKIRVNLNDMSMYERLILIPFWIRFLDNPSAPHHRKGNPDLAEKFMETEFKKSILAWIIDASKYYHTNPNLKLPTELKLAKDEYRNAMNIFLEFLNDGFILQDSKTTTLEVMKQNYYRVEEFLELFTNYCHTMGVRLRGVKIDKEFQKYLQVEKINNTRCYIGLIKKDN